MSVEATITEKLQKLWDLQLIDSQLDEIQILKGELPMEVADLEDEIAGLETRCKKLNASVKGPGPASPSRPTLAIRSFPSGLNSQMAATCARGRISSL